ncbi:MAG: DNA polymerase III subunit delta' [Bacteroidia bacterium]|nr:DNA polymerase III subunit delta' [Bacteroidia bacterium]
MQFNSVVGQSIIKKQLSDMVAENRVSHALLFSGNEGCGQLATALAYVQYLNCTEKTNGDSCGKCPQCIKIQKLIHPDLHLVFPINSTEKIKGDKLISSQFLPDFREAVIKNPYLNLFNWFEHIGIENKQGNISEKESDELIKKLSLRSYEAEYKCTIIWMAERMNNTCSNKLLKLLEEPPDKTLFILICQQPDQLLPTIISRTQMIKFNPLDNETVYQWVLKEKNISELKAQEIARQSNGNLNKALLLLTDENISTHFETFTSWMRLCYSKKFDEILAWVNETAKTGREQQKNFLEYALTMVRECLIRHGGVANLSNVNNNEIQFIEKFYPFINFRNSLSIMEEINTAIQHIERNGNPKIIFLDLSLKLFGLLKQ